MGYYSSAGNEYIINNLFLEVVGSREKVAPDDSRELSRKILAKCFAATNPNKLIGMTKGQVLVYTERVLSNGVYVTRA